MRRFAGQAARGAAFTLHRVAHAMMALAMLATVGAGVLAWRLAQGPIGLDWLARRLTTEADAALAPSRLVIGSASLGWNGWARGFGQPLVVRLSEVRAIDAAGGTLALVPRGEISFSLAWLLVGRIVPRAVVVEGAAITVTRSVDGTLGLDFGTTGQATAPKPEANPFDLLLAELAAPRGSDAARHSITATRWSQFARLVISDATLRIDDQALGAVWTVRRADLDLRRHRAGGVDAAGTLLLALPNGTIHLTVSGTLPRGAGEEASLRLTAEPFAPAMLASALPAATRAALAPLSALEAPLSATLQVALTAEFSLRHAVLQASLGSGRLRAGEGSVPLLGASLEAGISPDRLELRTLRAALAAPDGSAGPVLTASGDADRRPGRIEARLGLDVDTVPFADLARYWPAGVANGARAWLTGNVTAGEAHAAHLDLSLAAEPDGSDLTVLDAGGHVSGKDLTVNWLRPLPPVEHVPATLTVLSPDALDIAISGGVLTPPPAAPPVAPPRAADAAPGTLTVPSGNLRIDGLMAKDQVASIALDISGPLPAALALLQAKRLHLFERRKLALVDPRGDVTAKLTARVPLEATVGMEAIAIKASGQVAGGHLGDIIAGHALDHGNLRFDVDQDGLHLDGSAELAAIPAQLAVEMDFRSGPPSQTLQRITVSAEPSMAQLAGVGLDAGEFASGPASLKAAMTERRDGAGEIALQADLRRTKLALAPIAWEKPTETPAALTARVLLQQSHLAGIDAIALTGEGLALRGGVQFAAGRPASARFDEIRLGRTEARGELMFGAEPSAPLHLRINGTVLDLAPRFGAAAAPKAAGPKSAAPPPPPPPPASARSPPLIADASFGRVLLGPGRELTDLVAHVETEGETLQRAHVEVLAGRGNRLTVTLTPEAAGRALTARVGDAGAVLRAFGVLESVQGGRLDLTGRFADRQPGHPFLGRLQIEAFVLRDAPLAAKVLQAMTLYGLLDALHGPGLGFDQLVASFRLTDGQMTIEDSRAHSPSLGFTAKGQIDLDARTADLQGTIVPAYALNRLPGEIPLIGRLFSPEKGGGLFAATFTAKGPLDDPAVSVNPLAALTPGFLRGLFGMFDSSPAPGESGSGPPPVAPHPR